ncbi:UDP-N-acetylmuramoyl-tripeptide--D-alanyl-D-alanine ligase [Proteiniborus sp. MB09-C3]|uniref:UDP-N-acetylmuramoyl-tripeptide--D-alanyl-D- alanine ligase n=1 Tax=Proteiniborus sp. MB09-C3 TaxID=3050072 RepID=UPI002556B544|nr:UDP-N-acetylmuramoyl-tripeptide--D-alanyl-D-alanine ligase [Proteiniborus sp. MB09-C3]WIV12766.1 UDP-N-acetylmuramoyl-tripeptide--D-alanyl-D-alanine ligase [Proteiniborus sp. MB09-C3]
MICRTLREIEEMVGGYELKEENENKIIQGVTIDTRQIKAGQLFVPIVGERFNGHHFIKEAIEKGIAAAIWNKNETIPDIDIPLILVDDTLSAIQRLAKSYREQLKVKVIGITGSNGKTSTKDILASLLKSKYKTQKTFGNLNNHLGVPLTILELEEDTEMAVVEMGTSNLGEIELLTTIASPDVAIITNIGEAHLDELKSKENIAQAKLEILKGLDSNGLFVYYGDNPLLNKKIKNMNINYKTITFGQDLSNTYIPRLVSSDEKGISFSLDKFHCPPFYLPMLGKHQMYNATAAITVARYYGISFEQIQDGLLNVEATGMRNEVIHTERCTILNDSYKSNPVSLMAALDTLYSMKNYNQKIAVLGDMIGLGTDEVNMHREIGAQIDPEKIDYLLTIGPLAAHIAKTARPRFAKNKVFSYRNKTQLVQKLKKIMEYESIILIKGSRMLKLEEIVEELQSEEFLEKKEVV